MKKKGFSLIELLIVVVILGILASISYAAGINFKKNSRDALRKKDLRDIQIALQLYYDNKGHYPISTPESIIDGFIIGCEGVTSNPGDPNNWISAGEPWTCSDDENPTTYMKLYPSDPKPGKIQNLPDPPPFVPPHYMYFASKNFNYDVLCDVGAAVNPGVDCQYYKIVACLENIKDPSRSGEPDSPIFNSPLYSDYKCPSDRVPYAISGEKGET